MKLKRIAFMLFPLVCQLPVAGASQADTNTASEENFTAFESGQVRPLALSSNGQFLYAINTPDARLQVFKVKGKLLQPISSVRVGLEPVAVSVAPNGDIWVVNHLSDSISIVDASQPEFPVVKRTLLVGDEPRDIVFGGTQTKRAFITTAHRGQNAGRDPQFTTPGVGRADVWVFDANNQGTTLEGVPVTVLSLFADTPRALAVSADGSKVYAAAFNSGNRTTTVNERLVTNFGGLPLPDTDASGAPAPWAGLIVKYRADQNGQMHWLDEQNRVWDNQVAFSLPDKDVFAIDANLPVPALSANGEINSVGTVLFNMAVNPVNGKIYVSNLESRNNVRFEGHNSAGDGSSVRGHIAESRITVISNNIAQPRHLNKHIDYSQEGTPAEAAKSLAFPTGMQVSANGATLYVAALGSDKLGIFDTAALENDSFVPSTQNQVSVTGGGPTGLALNETKNLAYVMTRFDNGISIVDTKAKAEIGHVKMNNPEPASITEGRRFLYDAKYTSAHGDSACASCHIFGDLDSLAWDLGNPDDAKIANPNPLAVPVDLPIKDFHPLKGPMTTQSLKGMANHGPMHWRGDRTGAFIEPNIQPDQGAYNEQAAFKQFNPAFVGLLGRSAPLTDDEMQKFTNFMLQVMYPPNPVRNLDNSDTPDQAAGRAFYFNASADGTELPSDTFRNCNGCHTLDPNGNSEFGVAKPGFFGTDGRVTFEAEPQFFKVPQLRNMYQKVGMFGMYNTFGLPIDSSAFKQATAIPFPFNDNTFKGDQIRGFGFLHDGSFDTLFRFFGSSGFVVRPAGGPLPNPFGIPMDESGIKLRHQLEAFALAFPTNLAPIVGQQTTLTKTNTASVESRINLLEQRAAASECDVMVSGRVFGFEMSLLYNPTANKYALDANNQVTVDLARLRWLSSITPLTFTAVPKGEGARMAFIDTNTGFNFASFLSNR